jgi:hypothetical protein
MPLKSRIRRFKIFKKVDNHSTQQESLRHFLKPDAMALHPLGEGWMDRPVSSF